MDDGISTRRVLSSTQSDSFSKTKPDLFARLLAKAEVSEKHDITDNNSTKDRDHFLRHALQNAVVDQGMTITVEFAIRTASPERKLPPKRKVLRIPKKIPSKNTRKSPRNFLPSTSTRSSIQEQASRLAEDMKDPLNFNFPTRPSIKPLPERSSPDVELIVQRVENCESIPDREQDTAATPASTSSDPHSHRAPHCDSKMQLVPTRIRIRDDLDKLPLQGSGLARNGRKTSSKQRKVSKSRKTGSATVLRDTGIRPTILPDLVVSEDGSAVEDGGNGKRKSQFCSNGTRAKKRAVRTDLNEVHHAQKQLTRRRSFHSSRRGNGKYEHGGSSEPTRSQSSTASRRKRPRSEDGNLNSSELKRLKNNNMSSKESHEVSLSPDKQVEIIEYCVPDSSLQNHETPRSPELVQVFQLPTHSMDQQERDNEADIVTGVHQTSNIANFRAARGLQTVHAVNPKMSECAQKTTSKRPAKCGSPKRSEDSHYQSNSQNQMVPNPSRSKVFSTDAGNLCVRSGMACGESLPRTPRTRHDKAPTTGKVRPVDKPRSPTTDLEMRKSESPSESSGDPRCMQGKKVGISKNSSLPRMVNIGLREPRKSDLQTSGDCTGTNKGKKVQKIRIDKSNLGKKSADFSTSHPSGYVVNGIPKFSKPLAPRSSPPAWHMKDPFQPTRRRDRRLYQPADVRNVQSSRARKYEVSKATSSRIVDVKMAGDSDLKKPRKKDFVLPCDNGTSTPTTVNNAEARSVKRALSSLHPFQPTRRRHHHPSGVSNCLEESVPTSYGSSSTSKGWFLDVIGGFRRHRPQSLQQEVVPSNPKLLPLSRAEGSLPMRVQAYPSTTNSSSENLRNTAGDCETHLNGTNSKDSACSGTALPKKVNSFQKPNSVGLLDNTVSSDEHSLPALQRTAKGQSVRLQDNEQVAPSMLEKAVQMAKNARKLQVENMYVECNEASSRQSEDNSVSQKGTRMGIVAANDLKRDSLRAMTSTSALNGGPEGEVFNHFENGFKEMASQERGHLTYGNTETMDEVKGKEVDDFIDTFLLQAPLGVGQSGTGTCGSATVSNHEVRGEKTDSIPDVSGTCSNIRNKKL